ncbi:hypothetical protein MRY87_03545 [bacterium]|nr:hypothetical protein [bacterium]
MPVSQVLPLLVQLSEIDSALARLLAKRKQLEEQVEQSQQQLHSLQRDHEAKKGGLEQRRAKIREEERRIAEENEKLVERRKALSTFSNYKVQQSAQKEVEQAAKQLAGQEERVLVSMEELEALEKEVAELETAVEKAAAENQELLDSAEGEIDSLLERAKEKEGQRTEIASQIDSGNLATYDRIRNRHPVDPLVAVQDGKCGGCYMQVGAQMLVQVSRAASLVKCRGCSRVLFLPTEGDGVRP